MVLKHKLFSLEYAILFLLFNFLIPITVRSESERLQSLTEMQAHKMAEYVMYIKELEDRELILTQKVSIFSLN